MTPTIKRELGTKEALEIINECIILGCFKTQAELVAAPPYPIIGKENDSLNDCDEGWISMTKYGYNGLIESVRYLHGFDVKYVYDYSKRLYAIFVEDFNDRSFIMFQFQYSDTEILMTQVSSIRSELEVQIRASYSEDLLSVGVLEFRVDDKKWIEAV